MTQSQTLAQALALEIIAQAIEAGAVAAPVEDAENCIAKLGTDGFDLTLDVDRLALAVSRWQQTDAIDMRNRFAYLSKRLSEINTLPSVCDLYYPVKNEGENSGWTYRASYVTAEDIHRAAVHMIQYAPAVVSYPDAGVSELLIRDCSTIVDHGEVCVRPMYDVETRKLVGFQWDGVDAPPRIGSS